MANAYGSKNGSEKEIKRILVAEDDHISRILLMSVFKKALCETIFALNGEEAVEQYKNNTFDLILMDVSMPVMDGFQAAARIREFEAGGRHTPIIALTAHAFKEIEQQCYEAGMDDLLTKPLDVKSLLEKVSGWL